jgi:hypothetical protein
MQPGSPSMPEPGRSCRKGGGYRTGPGWGDRRSGYGARASGDGGKAFSSSGQSSLLGRRSVRAPERTDVPADPVVGGPSGSRRPARPQGVPQLDHRGPLPWNRDAIGSQCAIFFPSSVVISA